MGLFRPAYYSRKLDFHRRERAIEKERNTDRLKKAAIDKELDDNLRVIAIRKLNDPEVCEGMLMDFPGPVKHYVWERDFGQKPYEAAAQVLEGLGDQMRLERIFRSSQSHGIQDIVITHIKDPELLEEAAIDKERKYSTETSANAIARIRDEEVLARIAICSISSGKYAAKRVTDETLLGKIVLQCPVLDTRIEAARRMDNPDSVLRPVREEIEAGMRESPKAPEVELLAWCGDPTARVIYGCTRGTEDGELRFTKDDVLKADPDIIYPVLKKQLDLYRGITTCTNDDDISAVAWAIKLLHDNGILAEQIEAELPQTVQYSYCYDYWTNEEYKYYKDDERTGTVTLW